MELDAADASYFIGYMYNSATSNIEINDITQKPFGANSNTPFRTRHRPIFNCATEFLGYDACGVVDLT